MYNEERKKTYLSQTGDKIALKQFPNIEPFEESMGKDLCEMSKEELQRIADKTLGVLPTTLLDTMRSVASYRNWCMENGYKVFPLEHPIQLDSTKRIRECMVASPMHLQTILDKVFNQPERETVDCLYRCFLWMAFAGIYDQKDAVGVKTDEVDLDNLVIRHGGKVYEFERIALPAFRVACTAESFLYEHPKYKSPIWRKRLESPYLMRSFRAKQISLRSIHPSIYLRFEEKAPESGVTYNRIFYSGVFYRAYEMERAGFPPNFDSLLLDIGFNRSKRSSLMRDYAGWKKAFSP